MNSKVGKNKDFIENLDDLSEQVVIDDTVNNHGNSFCDFLVEGKLAIINRRICPQNDNFTCVPIKGRSVMDYFVVSQENIEYVSHFSVLTVNEALELVGHNRGVEGRISDHSVL